MGTGKKREQIEVWRLDDFEGIELRSGVSVLEPYPRHWHEEYQFCFIQEGGGELHYRGVHHNTPQTSLFIVHPGEVHSNQTTTGCSFRSIYADSELIRATASDIAGFEQNLPFFPDPMIFDKEIINDYLLLHLAAENSATTLERESAMLVMLSKLMARHALEKFAPKIKGKEHNAVKKAREFIVAHYNRHISLKELSRLARLSPFYLTRVFTKEIGMPPHAFQTQVRIANAKKFILQGLTFSDVAAITGFADQSHLHRHFKHLLKITPGEYLKNSKNVQY